MKFNKMNLRTLIIVLIVLIPFIWGTNLAAIWFSDMGTREVSIINRIGISFLVLGPYWIIFIVGVFRNLKRKLINYKAFNIMFFVIYCYYFFLINMIVNNLMLQVKKI
ncbi:hypothetical protein [Clostridium sp. LIBA-8841]|uniref:hypothetical protein n=1 Tax=Clostridium sp. LIBA-8841 TaxID=2987530 RepID=UPI002AC3F396|nr:hypothetical protein [Clostridium sp. LIBA-8841]MDZ5253956.1 hypothetical protein [Clostridium sp. LIBA-8841]